MQHKHILLAITGGIAAYKSAELVRLLTAQGAQVRVILTPAATQFITPLTLQTLSGHRVYTEIFAEELDSGMSHIELARWADLLLIAPATANIIAKLAHGHADDLTTTLSLVTTAPVVIAPAMNQQMWQHPATSANLQQLKNRNLHIVGPAVGIQACGEYGPGRMLEPAQIIDALPQFFNKPLLAHKNIVITAGPTHEALDPIRYITNPSSGKMGYALAEAASDAGANVMLIRGPTQLSISNRIHKINVTTALEMFEHALHHAKTCDIFIGAAAVSDYRAVTIAAQKIKKSADRISIELIKNPDILTAVSQLTPKPLLIGFAAETENLITHAKVKRSAKNLDMIIANRVGPNLGFQTDENEITVLTHNQIFALKTAPKIQLARSIIELISTNMTTFYP